jgi:hypothetical protein
VAYNKKMRGRQNWERVVTYLLHFVVQFKDNSNCINDLSKVFAARRRALARLAGRQSEQGAQLCAQLTVCFLIY